MTEPSCIDLAERFGQRYRITYEEQAAEWPVVERPWLARIACRYGHVGVQGGERLAAFTHRPVIGARLRRLPVVERAQGDEGVRIVFHVDHLAAVLAILQPYRRRVLSEAQKATQVARLAAHRFRAGQTPAVQSDFPAVEPPRQGREGAQC